MQDSIAMRDRFNPRSSSVGLKNRDSLLEVIAHHKHVHISDVNEIKMIKPILAPNSSLLEVTARYNANQVEYTNTSCRFMHTRIMPLIYKA